MQNTETTDLTLADQQKAVTRPPQSTALAERERAKVQAAMTIAVARPRNESAAASTLLRSADRARFAEGCEYRFPRGNTEVTGPSIVLAREAKRCWGNMDSGWEVIDRTEDSIMVQGWAVDLQTNTWQRFVQAVKILQQRKSWEDTADGGREQVTRWVRPDERDLVELIARSGAKVERNAILALIPPDVIDDTVDRARGTMQKAANGKLPNDPQRAARLVAAGFGEFGITVAQLVQKAGKPLEQLLPAEMDELRGIYRALQSGETTTDEHFASVVEAHLEESPTSKAIGDLKQKAHDAAQAADTAAEAADKAVEAAKICPACEGEGVQGEGEDLEPCAACDGSGEAS